MDILDYLNEYIRITRSCLLSPETFFNEIKGEEKRYLKPLAYALISLAVFSAGSSLLFFFLPYYASRDLITFNSVISTGFFITSIVLIFILLLAEYIAGGKKSFNRSFNVVCYSASVLNISWMAIVAFTMIAQYGSRSKGILLTLMLMSLALLALLWLDIFQYVFYVLVTGLSVISEITKLRASGAIILSVVIVFAMIMSGSYLLQESSDNPQPPRPPYAPPVQEIQQNILPAYLGSAPDVDGKINDNDRWDEGTQIKVSARGKNYIVTAKHDRENLYILMRWKGNSGWNDMISLYFEQDNDMNDSNLSTGLVDWYYQRDGSDPAKFGDGHYEPGFIQDNHQDGSLMVGYDVNESEWVQEWKIPLNSGDKDDIFIKDYPAELGFSIINENAGEGGIFPSIAYRSDPRTWARLNIINLRKYK